MNPSDFYVDPFYIAFDLLFYDWQSGIVLAKEDTYKNKKTAKAC